MKLKSKQRKNQDGQNTRQRKNFICNLDVTRMPNIYK